MATKPAPSGSSEKPPWADGPWQRFAGVRWIVLVVLNKVLFTAACLILPVLWGCLVNWLFDTWRKRGDRAPDDDSVFPDYQI